MTPRVGYVLLEYPRASETFIENELIALEQYGLPEVIFSLHLPRTVMRVRDSIARKVEYLEEPALRILSCDEPCRYAPETGGVCAELYQKALESDRPDALELFASALHVVRRARELNLSHLHCHYATTPTELAVLVNKIVDLPFSFTGHAKDIFTMRRDRLARRVRRARFAVACSEAGRRWIADSEPGAFENKVHRVYHGIQSEEWQMECVPQRPPLFVAIGRLTPKKGFDVFVRAAAKVLAQMPADFEIIGEGREEACLRGLIRELGVSRQVRLTGWLSPERIRERFLRARSLVHPGIVLESNNQDGVANVVLEAMAAGLPVIVSSIPALTEVVEHERTGLLVPPGDADALAAAMQRLAGDDALATRLATDGGEVVRAMTTQEAARQLVELFTRYA